MDESEWEFSKENVQPLRQGRKIANLEAALRNEHKLDQQRLAEQRQFEQELRTYDGDDPLAVWYEYILWGEQNFPKGGLNGNLHSLVEKCCSTFKEDERYKNDSRFLEVWLRMMNNCPEPLETYNSLFSSNMFVNLPNFYHNWALELEKNGHFKRADIVYLEGINRTVDIADTLKKHHRQFLVRLNSGFHKQEEEESSTDYRFPLIGLKFNGKKNEVPYNRVDAYLPGRTQQSLASFHPVKKNSNFKIHDENEPTPFIIQSNEQAAVLIDRDAIKENTKKPGKWSHAKMSHSKKNVVPITAVGQFAQPDFVVHEEEDAGGAPLMTPKRVGESKLPLSERKMARSNSMHMQLEKNATDSKERYMCCLQKLYNGLTELSFEELRLDQWKKKQRLLKIDS